MIIISSNSIYYKLLVAQGIPDGLPLYVTKTKFFNVQAATRSNLAFLLSYLLYCESFP